MSDSQGDWWMDASCRWHQGQPPPGWWQAGDRRWHPPTLDDVTEEIRTGSNERGAHLVGGRRMNLWEAYRGWPRWARLAAPIAASVLVIGALGAAATEGLRGDDPETTATDEATIEPDATTTAPNAATPGPTATTTVATTTTDSMPTTTAPAESDPAPTTATTLPAAPQPTTPRPTTNDIHPGAPCSPEGATAVSGDGVPLTCTTQKCHGAPFSQPRWRRTAC